MLLGLLSPLAWCDYMPASLLCQHKFMANGADLLHHNNVSSVHIMSTLRVPIKNLLQTSDFWKNFKCNKHFGIDHKRKLVPDAIMQNIKMCTFGFATILITYFVKKKNTLWILQYFLNVQRTSKMEKKQQRRMNHGGALPPRPNPHSTI